MKKFELMAVAMAAGTLLGSVSVVAHHAFTAEFDVNAPLSLKGTVTKVEFVNPHSWVYLDVKEPDGTVQNWAIEVGPPGPLFRRGITKAMLPVGAEIQVDGFRAADKSNRLNGLDMTFPDGRRIFTGSEGAGAPPRK